MKTRLRKQARSLVVTFTLGASACGGASSGPPPVIPMNPPMQAPRYRLESESTIARHGEVCELTWQRVCPPDTLCDVPAPSEVPCLDELMQNGALARAADGSCTIATEVCHEQEAPTCNPPAPVVVRCNTAAIRAGTQTRAGGRCTEQPTVDCPPAPPPVCANENPTPIDCPVERP